ncbi:PREDICTED: coenzyme Q-binding protein COQ10 homolog B, mitochondrial-like [Nanorana parkeri]|uniref:coenzyme Q-binding protein COQ10 homolog B, mitochondrial-like n=1 Tax=Nanorana parkeri TaxID=125878 RepID=UPI000854956B|nr:PREDICTED: coenzyme Q-binding protein COQ10 homolog B, mitochondrial-like [Nanorana parkeri]
MAGHCGRSSSVLLRALLETESRPCQAVIRRVQKQHGVRHLSSCGILVSQCTRLPQPSPMLVQTRSFLNLALPILGNKRMDYAESKVLGYSIDQMFDIVANVEDYKMFVPWCNSSKILSSRNGVTRAELEVGFPPIVERYVSEITVVPQYKVRAVCHEGKLFSHLETVWRFRPGLPERPNTCTLDFYVSFEFKSLLHSHLATVFFDEVAKQMVTAFENQAAKAYGRQTIPLQSKKLRAVQ